MGAKHILDPLKPESLKWQIQFLPIIVHCSQIQSQILTSGAYEHKILKNKILTTSIQSYLVIESITAQQ